MQLEKLKKSISSVISVHPVLRDVDECYRFLKTCALSMR